MDRDQNVLRALKITLDANKGQCSCHHNGHYLFYGKARADWNGDRAHDEESVVTHFNDVCWARFRGVIREGLIYINQHTRLDKEDQKLAMEWFEYVTQRSLFKDVFIQAPLEEQLQDGFYIDCNKPISHIMAGMQIIREVWEFTTRVQAWKALTEKGFTEDEALWLMNFFNGPKLQYSANSGGHSAFIASRMSFSGAKKFLKGEIVRPYRDEAPVNQKCQMWNVSEYMMMYPSTEMVDYFKEYGKKVGEGWNIRITITLDDNIINELKEKLRD